MECSSSFLWYVPSWEEINGGMVPKVNESDGATEINEDKHIVHRMGLEHLRKMLSKHLENVNRSRIPNI